MNSITSASYLLSASELSICIKTEQGNGEDEELFDERNVEDSPNSKHEHCCLGRASTINSKNGSSSTRSPLGDWKPPLYEGISMY